VAFPFEGDWNRDESGQPSGPAVQLPRDWPRRSFRALYALERAVNVHFLIDRMVESVNHGRREAKSENEVPVSLRQARVGELWFDWKIARSSRVNWIQPLEARLPARFPRSFRSLLERYEYPAFAIGPIVLFANTAEGVANELREEIWRDRGLSEMLIPNGFLQFGRPATGSYNPICFEAGGQTGSQEYAIVRLDHEEILCNLRIRVTERVGRSFYDFVEAQLSLGGAI
jgi:hypothetical protein